RDTRVPDQERVATQPPLPTPRRLTALVPPHRYGEQMDPITAARDWISQDPDPQTRDELTALIDSGDEAEIAARFAGTLQFGTAGLRGELGAGPLRMNRVTVAR